MLLIISSLTALLVSPPPAGQLSWDAPPECPGVGTVEARIKRETTSPVLQAEAAIKHLDDGSFQLTLVLTNGAMSETWTHTAPDCEELVTYVVLRASSLPCGTEPCAASPEMPPARNEDTPASSKETPLPVSRERVSLGVRVGASESIGDLPSTRSIPLGAHLGLILRYKRLQVEIGGDFIKPLRSIPAGLPDTQELASGDPQINLRAAFGLARVCGLAVRRPHVLLPLCIGLEAGGIAGALVQGVHVTPSSTKWQPWVGGRAGAELVVQLNQWLGIWMSVDVCLAQIRSGFSITGDNEVYSVLGGHRVGGRFGLGLEVRFNVGGALKKE